MSNLKLTEKETEIMTRLWRGAMTVRELRETYPEPKPHFNTLSTLVRILADKGAVAHVGMRNGAYVYEAVARQADMGRGSLSQVVNSFFNGNYFSAVSALVRDEKLSADELRELIEMVDNN